MASYNKFNSFVEAMAEKVHNLQSDTLKIFLTNSAPVATNTIIANITEITYTNCSTRVITLTSSSQSSGTYKLILQDLVLTASGGGVGPFRYVGVYNLTATNGEVISWFDYGSSITVNDTETFTVDFDGTNGLFSLT